MPALTVLNSAFLWMLPLALLPVFFHLFYRIRKRQRPFSTLMFFLHADPKLRSRRRIREWLTLLLRTLAIAFLLLALARPAWVGIGTHGATSVVVIVDNSGSMTAPARDGRSKLAVAVEAAQALVRTMQENDRVAVLLLVSDPAVGLPPGLTSDKQAALTALANIQTTEASGMPGRALEQALAMLREAQTPGREIHIFTDLQTAEWGKEAVPNIPPPPGTETVVHRILGKSAKKQNLAIGSITFRSKRIVAGRPFSPLVEVMNQGDIDVRGRLCVVDDKGMSSSREVAVPRRQSVSQPVILRPNQPHLEWAHLWVEDDGFPADNHAYVAFTPCTRLPVLFVGQPDAFGLLPLAIAPEQDGSLSGFVPSYVDTKQAMELLQNGEFPTVTVTTWEGVNNWTDSDSRIFRSFVEKGGILLVLPSARGTGQVVQPPDWLGSIPQAEVVMSEGLSLTILDVTNPLWDDLRDPSGKARLTGVRAFRFRPLRASVGAVGLLGTANGDIVMAQHRVGNGFVFTSGIAADTKSSNLPLRSSFLALTHSMALMRDVPQKDLIALVAGEHIQLPEGVVQVSTVAGSPIEWKGKHSDLITLPRSGVYTATIGTNSLHVAVRCSTAEGDDRCIESTPVPVLAALSHKIVSYDGTENFAKQIRLQRAGLDFFVPLLVLVIVVIVLEGLVANPALTSAGKTIWDRWRPAVSALLPRR